MFLIKYMEIIAPYLGLLFVVSFLVKIINYSIFDYYKTGLGTMGSLLIGIFTHYKRYEIEDEEKKEKKVSKIVNNVCGYIMLSIIVIPIIILFILYIIYG